MNKLTLKYELEIDFNLVAITSPLKDYRLCYYINKMTGLDLAKTEDHTIQVNKKNMISFNKFDFFDPLNETDYHFLSNKGIEGGILIPEMKTVDFFLLVKNALDEDLLISQINIINKLIDVVVASEIDPNKLKSKENLVF